MLCEKAVEYAGRTTERSPCFRRSHPRDTGQSPPPTRHLLGHCIHQCVLSRIGEGTGEWTYLRERECVSGRKKFLYGKAKETFQVITSCHRTDHSSLEGSLEDSLEGSLEGDCLQNYNLLLPPVHGFAPSPSRYSNCSQYRNLHRSTTLNSAMEKSHVRRPTGKYQRRPRPGPRGAAAGSPAKQPAGERSAPPHHHQPAPLAGDGAPAVRKRAASSPPEERPSKVVVRGMYYPHLRSWIGERALTTKQKPSLKVR